MNARGRARFDTVVILFLFALNIRLCERPFGKQLAPEHFAEIRVIGGFEITLKVDGHDMRR